MLFHVTMDVDLPPDLDPATRTETLGREKAYCQDLQRRGKWVHIWRVVGQYANVSVFEVDSPDELHEILWNLPLFPFMTVRVTPLCPHPSAL
ncbi:muconolactone Delta-isomerase [Kribbella sp. CA-253562]|uniref:muconolactone Delta-isomerase n=1 Tax=Kribbella sp. CA-253562 TaxID=3239942 RepID=UPI003D8F1813